MPSLAQRIETVLKQHALYDSEHYYWWNHKCLVADLLALFPQPSREGLEKLLLHIYHCNPPGVCLLLGRPCKKTLDDFMAWATGEAERPKWCDCIIWCQNLPGGTTGWVEKATGCEVVGWKFCPICGVARPSAG